MVAPLKPVKIDLKAQLKFLFTPSSKAVQVVDVPEMSFLMVDGAGDPNAQPFQTAVQTLYCLAYTIKFGLKKRDRVEFPVTALEGLWSSGGSSVGFDSMARDTWRWTLMIVQPEVVTPEVVAAAGDEIGKKDKSLVTFRLERFGEGLSAQVMHVGPYSAEQATIKKIREFMALNGYAPNGRHHEVYLGDPRRASPSKLRTILRQPIK